jgi:hypothetical protein
VSVEGVPQVRGAKELGVKELGVKELGVKELGVKELGVKELGVKELGVAEMEDDVGVCTTDDVRIRQPARMQLAHGEADRPCNGRRWRRRSRRRLGRD